VMMTGNSPPCRDGIYAVRGGQGLFWGIHNIEMVLVYIWKFVGAVMPAPTITHRGPA